MIRFGGLFCTRAKGYSSLCQNIPQRTASKFINELRTVGAQLDLNNVDKVEDVGNSNATKVDTTARSISDGSERKVAFKRKFKPKPPGEIQRVYDLEANLSLVMSLSVEQGIEVLKFLVHKNNRSLKLLRQISHKICFTTSDLTMKMCSDLLYCTARLSYKDPVLLDKIADNILSQNLSEGAKKLLPSMIQSIGVLKYRNCELIEFLLKNILLQDNPRKTEDMLKSLMTLAIVNFNSPYAKIIINDLNKCSKTDFYSTRSYLEFVWSCTLLSEYSPEHFSHVLSKSYIDILSLIDGHSNTNVITNIKLQNINAAATVLLPEYNGPTLEKPLLKPLYTNSKMQFLSIVMDGLSNLFPKSDYFKTAKNTGAGFLLDVECCIDSQGKPVSLHKMNEGGKIGIILLDYNDFCLDKQNTVSGLSTFKQKILEAKGYKVITISYTEYDNSLKLLEKIQCLENKFKNVCKSGLKQSKKS